VHPIGKAEIVLTGQMLDDFFEGEGEGEGDEKGEERRPLPLLVQ